MGLGVTGTHAPHVNPGNPGAPGVDAAGVYPVAHAPPHTTPHAVYPAGQGAQAVPDLYCPEGQTGEDDGVIVDDGVRATAASSRSTACGWYDAVPLPDLLMVGVVGPDLVGDGVAAADLVGDGVAAADLVAVLVAALDLVDVCVFAPDLDGELVTLGVCVGDTGMHAPQTDFLNPTAQVPEKAGAQDAYPAGQGEPAGVGVSATVLAAEADTDDDTVAAEDTDMDEVEENCGATDADTDDVGD